MAADDVAALLRDRLAESGLTEDDGRSLGLTALTADQSAYLGFWRLPAMKIPYHAIDGKVARHAPGWPDFYRVRALRVPPPKYDADGKLIRFSKYLQPDDSGVCAYFPRVGPFTWSDVASDHTYQLLVTEGEMKAAKGCREGFPTIGLGGVWNWRAQRDGLDFLPALASFVWARREVVVCFDSDAITNPDVAAALRELAEELCRRGAIPRVLTFPQPGDSKVGLDDFLLDHSVGELKDLIFASRHLTMSRALWDLNDRWAFVEETAVVARRDDGRTLKTVDMAATVTARTSEAKFMSDGRVSLTMVSAAGAWLSWPLRATVRSVAYDPSRPRLSTFRDERGIDRFNVWPGFSVEPRAGDVSLFLEMVASLFDGAADSDREWFIDWLAYPLWKPGTKLATAVILHGAGQGTGKSSVGYTMREIYGHANFSEISQDMLLAPFNTWAVRKQLIMGDDVTGSDKREVHDFLNKLITQRDLYVNEKNQPNYTLADRANYMFTSNRNDAFLVADEDRRYFVHEVRCRPRPVEWWDRYYKWLQREGGAAAIFAFLIGRDLSAFDPFGRAPETGAKRAMASAGRGSVGEFVRDLLEYGPEEMLRLPDGSVPDAVRGRDLFTSRELLSFYQARYPDDGRVTSRTVSSQLSAAGVRQVHGGKPLLGRDGRLDRFFAVRRGDAWERSDLDAIRLHLSGDQASVRPSKPKAGSAGARAKVKSRF